MRIDPLLKGTDEMTTPTSEVGVPFWVDVGIEPEQRITGDF